MEDEYVNLCRFYFERNRKSRDQNGPLISFEKLEIDERRDAKMAHLNYFFEKLKKPFLGFLKRKN